MTSPALDHPWRDSLRETNWFHDVDWIIEHDYYGDVLSADVYFDEPVPHKADTPWVRPVPQPPVAPAEDEWPLWLKKKQREVRHLIPENEFRMLVLETLTRLNQS